MRIRAIYLYLLFVAWVILLELLLKYGHLNVTGLGVTLAFLTLIFAPGIFLWRVLRLNAEKSAKLLYVIGFGFGFYFFWSLLGILFSLTIYQVLWLTIGSGIIIFILALWRDRKEIFALDFSWLTNRSWSDWLLTALVLTSSLVAFLAIDAQTEKLIGDGWFHLAILEKIVSGVSLNSSNLWSVSGAPINPVYAFPIWHVFTGELSKILNIAAYPALRLSMLPLVLIDFMVIYSVSKTFFAKFELTILSYLSYLVLLLLGNFYLLVAIVSPDSLVRLLLFPLVIGLAINLIFDQPKIQIKQILIITLLIIFMGLIHFTQLLEFVFILSVFLIFWAIFYRQKEVFFRGCSLWLGLLILLAPYLLIFQRSNLIDFFRNNADNFANLSIAAKSSIDVLYLYPLLIIPLMVLFAKKTPKLLWLVISLLILFLISYQELGMHSFFLKYFGEVFTLRAASDILIWLYWGFGLYLILWLINYLLGKIYQVNIVLVILLFLGILIAPLRNGLIYFSREIIFNSKNNLNIFLFNNFWLVVILSIILVIIVYLLGKYFFKINEWSIPEPKNKGNFAVLILVALVILALPFLGDLKQVYAQNPNGSIVSDRTKNLSSDISVFGGQDTVDFLRGLPIQSVFVVSTPTMAQNILLYNNFFVAEYPYAVSEFKQTAPIFDPLADSAQRLNLLHTYQADYILTSRKGEAEIFDADKENFQKIYQKAFTFQVTSGKVTNYQARTVTIYRYLGKTNL